VNSNYFANFADFQEFIVYFWDRIKIGKAHTHLYFVFISVQFYLMFPLFLYIFKRYPKLTKYLILIGFVLQWSFSIYNNLVWKYENVGSLSISYMSHYLTGAFIGIYYEEIKEWVKSRRWVPALLTAFWLASVLFH